ncbi:MAG: lytic transglycosylase domain-containing protein [Firmicutes bacterium]|nr:lytic transglycosylase domain-containing protein [Bacillota bacterium]
MTQKIRVGAVLVILLVAAITGYAYAESMLTSPPAGKTDGLIFVGDENKTDNEPQMGKDSQTDVLCVPMNKNTGRNSDVTTDDGSGVQVVNPTASPEAKKYPSIFVRCKTYVPVAKSANSSKGKYGKKFSSRGVSYKAAYQNLDITPIIVREAKKNGISPVLLKAVIQTESNFNPYAVSCHGAQGLCQLIPSTARMVGVNDAFDPEQNIAGGAKYLGMLSKMNKSLDLVLASYNAGPGAVKRAGGIPNNWETRGYVIKVKRNMYW